MTTSSSITRAAVSTLRGFSNGELADMMQRQHSGHEDWKHPHADDLEPLARAEAFKRVGAVDLSATYEDWESLHRALVSLA